MTKVTRPVLPVEQRIWKPDQETISRSHLGQLLKTLDLNTYQEAYEWTISEPSAFWKLTIEQLGIRFLTPPESVLDLAAGPSQPSWLKGARWNIAESCFQAAPDAPAILSGNGKGSVETMSYADLHEQVNAVANGLQSMGLQTGDAVAVFMPMTPRSVAIYLGIILAGCVVVSIADSFSADQLAMRLRLGNAKAIFTVAAYGRDDRRIDLLNRVMEAEGPPAILTQDAIAADRGLRDNDVRWSDFVGSTEPPTVYYGDADDAINILFSSGTTGEPKAIPWDHTTPIKAAADARWHQDVHPGDVVAWPTNLGWMMGPWLIFGALTNRASIALFDGPPLNRQFGTFVQNANVTMLGVVPIMVRKWRERSCMEGLDWSSIRVFSSTGECSNADDMMYLSALAGGKPIIEYCGGTEIGGGYITSSVLQENYASAFSTPALGSRMLLLNERHEESDRGEVYLVPPAMGLSRRLLNRDHAAVYHDGVPAGPDGEMLRRHGDEFQRFESGYYRALGRTDDTMNLGGIKVSAAEIESTLAGVCDVAELAAIAVAPNGGGPQQLVVCVGVTEQDFDGSAAQRVMQRALRERLNPLFKVHRVFAMEKLPRTASNKIMRRELRDAYVAERG